MRRAWQPGQLVRLQRVFTSKAAVVTQAAENAGQPAIMTIFSDAWSLAGPVEQAAGWLAKGTLRVAPFAWGGAALADLTIHAQCENESVGNPAWALGVMP